MRLLLILLVAISRFFFSFLFPLSQYFSDVSVQVGKDMHEMNRVELYSLITISVTICMGGYSNVDAGAGAGGSSWGCGGDVSWVDMVVIISNGLSILWMLVLLIFGGKSELVNQGRRLSSMVMKRRSQSTAALYSLDNPLSRPGSMGDIELSEVRPSLAIEMELGTERALPDTDTSETVMGKAVIVPPNVAASVQAINAVVESKDFDPIVAAALMEEIATILLEGTQGSSRGEETDQEENIGEEEDRQQGQPQHEDDNDHTSASQGSGSQGGEGRLSVLAVIEDPNGLDICSAASMINTLPPAPSAGAVSVGSTSPQNWLPPAALSKSN